MLFSEPQTIHSIEEEVASIRDRFDDIVTILEARGTNIDVTLSQADKYNIAFNEVSMWLDSADGFELRQLPISDDLEELQKQMSEQRVRIFVCALLSSKNMHYDYCHVMRTDFATIAKLTH